MDEGKLAELFRDAVHDVPPPSFSAHDVADASHRQRLQLRNRIVAGSGLAVVVLAGAILAGVTLWGSTPNGASDTSVASAGSGNSGQTSNRMVAPNEVPSEHGGSAPNLDSKELPSQASGRSPEQGGDQSGDAGLGAGGTPTGCEKADRELAAALAGELPAAADQEPLPAVVDCPAGSRGAAFLFGDDAGDGAVSVVLAPAGSVNQANPPWAGLPANTVHELRNTAGGRLLIVVSQPQSTDGDAPFGDQMPKVAADLAAEF